MKKERDLTQYYQNPQDPQRAKDNKQAEKDVAAFVKKRKEEKRYLTDIESLKKAIEDYKKLRSLYYYGTKESCYAWLQTVLSQDEEIKADANKAWLFSQELFLQIDFFVLSLGKIEKEQQQRIREDKSFEENIYRLERIRKTAQYDLSEAEERIITKLSKNAYSDRKNMIGDFFATSTRPLKIEESEWKEESEEKIEEKSFEQLMSSLSDTNKKTRDEAATHVHNICNTHVDVATREINAILEYKYTIDQLRGYERPDQASHISDDVETATIDTLIEAVEEYHHLSQRLYSLKAKLLWQKKLAYHERNVPIILGEEKEYSWDEAVSIVSETFKKLDPEFDEVFQSFLENGQIDVFPKKGKQGGAFQAGMWPSLPSMVMLNYTDKLVDITTLAHEMGHALNTYFVGKKQHALYYGYGLFTAEVASTFMEDFVYDTILQDADKKTQLSLLMQRLNDFISSVIRQIACYTFEQELHKERRKAGYLWKESIGKLFSKHMSKYMWPSVSQDEGSENRRTYRSHIRRYFYTYSYAGWLLLSKALQAKTRADRNFIKTYKDVFLSAGRCESPETTFKKMGIDITQKSFRTQWLDEVEKMLEKAETLATQIKEL